MALNTLTLSVSAGVIGRPFLTAVSGITAGSIVEVADGGTQGFGYVNGKLSHRALPYDTQLVILRERLTTTGESKLTFFVITAAGAYAIKTQADALVPGNKGYRVAGVTQGDGSLVWTLFVEAATGATTSATIGAGATVTLGALTLSGSLQIGTAASGTINGATVGSTITGNIPGITVNSGARTYSGTPTGSAATIANGLVETLAGATNTPRPSSVTVAAAGVVATTAPSIAGTPANGQTLTATPGVWTGSPTIVGGWYRDGTAIGNSTLTYVYSSAADDGRYITYKETANGTIASVSNALIAGQNALYYSTSFAGADGTELIGYDGWADSSGSHTGVLKLSGNDLFQYATGDNLRIKHAAPGNDHEARLTVGFPAGQTSGNASTHRYLGARFTNLSNGVVLDFTNNGGSVHKFVAGTDTTLGAFAGFGRDLVDGDVMSLRVVGNYAKVYLNGTQTAQSAAANGGLGYDISDVPASSFVAFGPTQIAGGATYPFKVAQAFAVYSIPANDIAVSSVSVENISGVGTQRIRLQGTVSGTVTQLQALVLSPTGVVLSDWSNVAGLSGSAFNVVTPQLPQAAEGATVTVWLRDATLKSVATSTLTAVPVNAQQTNLTMGINATKTSYTTDNLLELSTLFVKRQGAYRNVFRPGETVDASVSVYVPAVDVALDSNWFPTQFPNAVSGYNADPAIDYPFFAFRFQDVVPTGAVGTYDVQFTPKMRWVLEGGSTTMVLSNYNEAAGTATITIANIIGPNPAISLRGYDSGSGYVAGALPPAGSGYLRIIRQGSDGKKINAASKASLGALASKNTNRGFVRWMGDLAINREGFTGVTYATRSARRPGAAVFRLSGAEEVSYEQMLETAIDTSTNIWLNIPDTADPTFVLDAANYFFTNMPAGMKVAVEYSNEVWNFGLAFQQAQTIYARAVAAGVAHYVQYAREFKSKVLDVFESVFGVNSPRFHPMLAWQAQAISPAIITAMLDEGNLYQKVKGFAIGPYIGGGIAGIDIGNYLETSVFTKAQRDVIDPTGANDVTLYKTNLFAAQAASSLAVKQRWMDFANALAQYSVSKGLSRTAIRPAAYEYFWESHVESNHAAQFTGSITSNTLTVTAAPVATLRVGDVVVVSSTGLGPRTITALGTGTGGIGTYTVSAGSNVASVAMRASTSMFRNAVMQAFAQTLRDARAGTAMNAQNDWLKLTGGDMAGFAHAFPAGTSISPYGSWGYEDAIGNESQEPYASTAAWITANT